MSAAWDAPGSVAGLLPRRIRSRLLAGLMVVGVALAVMGVSEGAYRLAEGALLSVANRQQTRYDALQLRALLVDAETAQRGFLMTGRDSYLAPLQAARPRIDEVLERLRQQYAQTSWAALVDEVRKRSYERLSELQETVALSQAGRTDAWQTVLLTDIGREKMDAVRVALGRLESYENHRIAVDHRAIDRALTVGRFGVHGLSLLSLLWLFHFLRKNEALLRLREEHAAELRHERDRLDGEVVRRTAELSDLAQHLTLVREDERGRLARELHDELGSLLTAVKLDIARVRRLGSREDLDGLRERLQHMSDLIDEGISLKRRIIEDLRPSALSNLGLHAALEILTREFGERSGLQVEAKLEELPLSDSAALAVYRLVQESLTNVLRHAQASRVDVSLQALPGAVQVMVQDDGRGFELQKVGAGHHGLLGMRYRLEALGGRLDIESAPGQGTRLLARLPR